LRIEDEADAHGQHAKIDATENFVSRNSQPLDRFVNYREVGLARIGHFDPARKAAKQRRPKLRFEPFDLLTHGRLRKVELIRGMRETQVARR
jgi:hypothetical protein